MPHYCRALTSALMLLFSYLSSASAMQSPLVMNPKDLVDAEIRDRDDKSLPCEFKYATLEGAGIVSMRFTCRGTDIVVTPGQLISISVGREAIIRIIFAEQDLVRLF